ncbi:MAG: dihydrolipoamide acetyltransferase family protein, partial [Umezawaea sp.]
MPDFRLPDLGEGLTEGEIVTWLVSVGDKVSIDQPVVEVETAKAVVEVPCPFEGVVTATHGRAGESLAVGSVLLTVGGEGFQEPGVVVPEQGSGNVLIGYGTSEAPRRKRGRRRAAAPQAVAPQPVAAFRPGVISPLVRKLARDNGVDVAVLTGSGPDGIVRRHDVEQELARRVVVPAPVEGRRIPLKGLRKTVADKLSTSRREIPEATVWVDVDATEFLAARAALKDVGLLALLARFTVLGLKKFPELNSRVDGHEIVVLDRINLGFAAQTDRGLVVPVVKDAQDLTASELSAALADRTAAARAGKLGPADLTGGTFTVNNYGV